MILFIHGRRLVAEAERDFSQNYPYLKLQFLQHSANGNTPLQKAKATQRLNEIWYFKSDNGSVDINDQITVGDLKSMLNMRFGLLSRLFRKSGSAWLEVTLTQGWTLKQQNDHGRELSEDKLLPGSVIEDYDLHRDPD
jgi:hypothetical protein